MKGYGPAQRFTPSHRGRRQHLIAGALAGLTMLAVSGCSLLEETSREPGALNLPATNAPSTETVPSTLPPTATDQTTTSRTYSVPEDDTFRQVITDAPAVGVGAFHIGATTATGERMDDVSGGTSQHPTAAIGARPATTVPTRSLASVTRSAGERQHRPMHPPAVRGKRILLCFHRLAPRRAPAAICIRCSIAAIFSNSARQSVRAAFPV